MKEFETIKLYGKTLNTWKHVVTVTTLRGNTYEEERTSQIELAYNEYSADGELIRKGSEDFSIGRYNDNLKIYRIFAWDGEKTNKAGSRWFEEAMTVKINKSDRKHLAHLARRWFPNAAEISIR